MFAIGIATGAVQPPGSTRTPAAPPSWVDQHVAIGMATERSATTRLKDSRAVLAAGPRAAGQVGDPLARPVLQDLPEALALVVGVVDLRSARQRRCLTSSREGSGNRWRRPCLSHEGSGNNRQRRCLSREGSGDRWRKAVSYRERAVVADLLVRWSKTQIRGSSQRVDAGAGVQDSSLGPETATNSLGWPSMRPGSVERW